MQKNKNKAQEVLNHLLSIRKLKKREKFMCVLSGGKMTEEDYLKTMEIVNSIKK